MSQRACSTRWLQSQSSLSKPKSHQFCVKNTPRALKMSCKHFVEGEEVVQEATILVEPNCLVCRKLRCQAVPYLVVPWFICQHFHTLESRCFTLGSEGCSLREELHVDALAQVNEGQAMAEPINVTCVVVQEPSTTTRKHPQCLQAPIW